MLRTLANVTSMISAARERQARVPLPTLACVHPGELGATAVGREPRRDGNATPAVFRLWRLHSQGSLCLFQRAFVSHNVVLKIHVPPAQRQSLAPARARSKEERNDRAKGAAFKVAQNGADLFL